MAKRLQESLQAQLLKSGLINEKQLKKANKDKRKKAKQQNKNQASDAELMTQHALQVLKNKQNEDRKRSQASNVKAEKKAEKAQVKQLIAGSRLEKNKGDMAYHFTDNKMVKTLYVSGPIQKQLIEGKLAIIKLNGNYDIVPLDIAEKISLRDANYIICKNQTQNKSQQADENDPYADFQIPDDLTW